MAYNYNIKSLRELFFEHYIKGLAKYYSFDTINSRNIYAYIFLGCKHIVKNENDEFGNDTFGLKIKKGLLLLRIYSLNNNDPFEIFITKNPGDTSMIGSMDPILILKNFNFPKEWSEMDEEQFKLYMKLNDLL